MVMMMMMLMLMDSAEFTRTAAQTFTPGVCQEPTDLVINRHFYLHIQMNFDL